MTGSKSESARERALARARATRRETGAEPPARRERTAAAPGPVRAPAPVDNGVAALAARYLLDGYTPEQVSDLLGVDRRWCRAVDARLSGGGG